MSNNYINISETCRRYAKALFLASDKGNTSVLETKKSFNDFIKIFEEIKELKSFFKSPLINPLKKSEIVKKLITNTNFSENFSNFLITLANNGKLYLVEKIHSEFNKLLNEKDGILEVSIVTSQKLESSKEKKILLSLEKKLSKKINLKKIVDKNIIGGVILKVNSIMIDNSIRTKLLDYNSNERLN